MKLTVYKKTNQQKTKIVRLTCTPLEQLATGSERMRRDSQVCDI